MNERGTGVNVAYGIIAVLSVASNLLFCLAMAARRRRGLKTTHDRLIFSLAVADAFTGKYKIKMIHFIVKCFFYPFTFKSMFCLYH